MTSSCTRRHLLPAPPAPPNWGRPSQGGRQLVGLEQIGTPSYQLDFDAEAIYVLAGFSHFLTRPRRLSSLTRDQRPLRSQR